MITKEQLAERLNGREYMQEITKSEKKEAAESGLVVVFGASDDLIEFRGAIDDEQGAWQGGDFYIDNGGELFDEDHEDCCKYKTKAREAAHKITAIWDRDGYSWIYETKIPHVTFKIMEDGEKYCRGIVFSLQELIAADGLAECCATCRSHMGDMCEKGHWSECNDKDFFKWMDEKVMKCDDYKLKEVENKCLKS